MAKTPRSVVLGTAGHIDHGKTTLVRALTGRDTDRLPEEKKRGITIELGFAPWPIAADLEASIIDVPGHENFVRTMVAGAGGIDAVVLVVSAEDGVMPQTREHINVCRLLGVSHGVVALTKVDQLEDDEEAIELAVEDVREALVGTVFEDAPIVPCSGQTGAGIDTLTKTIRDVVLRAPKRDAAGDPVLPLDRAFTIKGHGTVVTGTLLQGTIGLGKDIALDLVPAGDRREPRAVRPRAIQVRLSERDRVLPGNRVALNLGGIDVGEVERGDVITHGNAVGRSSAFHVWLEHLPGHSPNWKLDTTLQICVGTAHAVGHLDPLWREDATGEFEVAPGEQALVRIRTDVPLPVWRGARVIVRAFHDATADHQGRTVGGGVILDPQPSSGRSQRPRWIALGRVFRSADLAEQTVAVVEDAGLQGIRRPELAFRLGTSRLDETLTKLTGKGGTLVRVGTDRYVHEGLLRPLVQSATTYVDRFHAANPMQPGVNRAAVESQLGPRIEPEVASLAVDRAIERRTLHIVDDQGTLARPGKGLQVGGELPEHVQRVLTLYDDAGSTPPTLREVATESGLDERKVLEIVGVLQRRGDLIKVTPDLSFSKASHDRLLGQVKDRLREEGTIDVQALKAMTGLSRKFVVPFLEHLDGLQITLRKGNMRIPGPRA
jgi:selenocysteine-specific elongation factor